MRSRLVRLAKPLYAHGLVFPPLLTTRLRIVPSIWIRAPPLARVFSSGQQRMPGPLNLGELSRDLQNHSYRIIANISTLQGPLSVPHTFLAWDATASAPTPCTVVVHTAPEHEEYVSIDVEQAAQHFLIPRSTFSSGSSRVQVFSELLGPNVSFLSEVGGPEMSLLPATMIRQMAFQILQSLEALHRVGRSTNGKDPEALQVSVLNV